MEDTQRLTAKAEYMPSKHIGANVSLDVVELTYDTGKHIIQDISDGIKRATPSSMTSMLPEIKPYVSDADCAVLVLIKV